MGIGHFQFPGARRERTSLLFQPLKIYQIRKLGSKLD